MIWKKAADMPHRRDARNKQTGRATSVAAGDLEEEQTLGQQLRMMQQAFVASPSRRIILLLAAGLLAVIIAIAVGQIFLNRWYKPFYDTLERRDLPAFLGQFVVFGQIAGVILVLNVIQTWLGQWIKIKLREGLTRDLITEWMKPTRAFRLANAGSLGINPDQRIHEDARHLTDLTAGLGIGLVQSGILLVSFIGVLWSLSAGFVFRFQGYAVAIPGYMVWAAILYAGIASWFSWLVGRPLVKLNGEHYQREAALRFSLMRVNEHIEAVSLSGGEANEKRRIERDLASVLEISRGLMFAMTRLTWVTAGYGWVTVIAPIVIAAPVFFAGNLSFGGLMMAVGAFNQVHASLRWFVDNIEAVADWRATLLRVSAFRSAMLMTDERYENDKRIVYAEPGAGTIVMDDLAVASPSGSVKLADAHVEILPGDRVLITARTDVDKSSFFRAVTGLWPWGRGRLALPPSDSMAFIPRTPYFPPGSVAETLIHPAAPDRFPREQLASVLTRLGLDRFVAGLDQSLQSQVKPTEAELRLLAIARLGLHKPRWIVVEEVLDTLDPETYQRVVTFFTVETAKAAIINIGRMQPNDTFFKRVLHLENDPGGKTLKRLQPRSLRTRRDG
ncbi:putative ATP-binding cassette transporter [Rhizobium sp. 9140]|nr:putative ATP-binding cassette transporter [Rhizobium sp. 9140]